MAQSSNSVAPQQVMPLLALATKLLREGRPVDAIAPLREAALLEPLNPMIQHDLGLACLEVGNMADAISALQWAVSCDPRYADAHFRLGIALEKVGDFRQAVAAYDRATQLVPSLSEAWFRAGALVSLFPSRRSDRLFSARGSDRGKGQLCPIGQGTGAAHRGSRSGSRAGASTNAGERSCERDGA